MRPQGIFCLSSALAFFIAFSAFGAPPKGVIYSIEPIIGYEVQKKENPDRAKSVLVYGARALAGYRILSAEAEFTQGKSDEFILASDTTIGEKTQKLRLGLRSTLGAGILNWYLRGGAEAQKLHRVTTVGSAAPTTYDRPIKFYPYLGTGLGIQLGASFGLNVSATATIRDIRDMKQNEYTYTTGLRIAYNTR
jgi:hypothetical protein